MIPEALKKPAIIRSILWERVGSRLSIVASKLAPTWPPMPVGRRPPVAAAGRSQINLLTGGIRSDRGCADPAGN